MSRSGWIIGVLLLCLLPSPAAAEESYVFDLSEIEKKPYHFSGYLEAKPVVYGLDDRAAFYQLRFFNDSHRRTVWEANGRVRLEGGYEKGPARIFARLNTDLQYNDKIHASEKTTFYEAYASVKPLPSLKIDAGKKTMKWGKGYAWNPVAFLDRPKNPDDPEQAMEGYIVATADVIRSFDGPLKTVSFTPAFLPVCNHVNTDFGNADKLNFSARLYFLLFDTDVDFMFMTGGSRPDRYGVDFSRNVGSNFEIHGEYAWLKSSRKIVLDPSGTARRVETDAHRFLIGLRYLASFELTTIVEFYHAGDGFTSDEMESFFHLIHRGYGAYRATGNPAGLGRAAQLAESGYARPNPMRNYLYVRLIQKDPFDILYFSPSLTCMINTDDLSVSVMPELLYTGIANMELRLRASVLAGARDTDFGEKQNDYRIELRAGIYF
ncbi:MAG: hypothetical protein M0P04_08090 [Syntrophales bacterium]|nr:hypothetical protein [Syntrophales bacterium]